MLGPTVRLLAAHTHFHVSHRTGPTPPATTSQETITNVIKHADARTIEIRTAVQGEGASRVVLMEVVDDGRGFDADASDPGRGIAHMRMRAERIGARLTLRSSAVGTRVQLALPAPQ